MTYETIQLEMQGSICVLTLNRPDRLNALTVQTATNFKAAVHERLENGARVIVLTGSGRAFCAGGDMRKMQELASNEGPVEAFFDEPLRILNESILLIRQTPVPFITAVNGVASMAEKLASAPAAAIGQIKRLLEASATNDYASQLDPERRTQIEAGKTKDFAEGVSALLEKRLPRFVGS